MEYQKRIVENLEELRRPLSRETETDIKYRVDVLVEIKRLEVQMKKCRENIATLDKNSGMIMKRIQLSQLEEILAQLDTEISQCDRRCGQIQNSMTDKSADKELKEAEYAERKSYYLMLASKEEHFSVLWNSEYEKCADRIQRIK